MKRNPARTSETKTNHENALRLYMAHTTLLLALAMLLTGIAPRLPPPARARAPPAWDSLPARRRGNRDPDCVSSSASSAEVPRTQIGQVGERSTSMRTFA